MCARARELFLSLFLFVSLSLPLSVCVCVYVAGEALEWNGELTWCASRSYGGVELQAEGVATSGNPIQPSEGKFLYLAAQKMDESTSQEAKVAQTKHPIEALLALFR